MPRISVLLPARNAEATLRTALASLERQRERDWECVVVDDGSSDATAALTRGVAAQDSRVRLVPGAGRGLVAALQTGLAECRADVVARMDADDWMHRDRLAAQLALLASQPELAGVGCHVRLFPRASLSPGRLRYERWLNSIRNAEEIRREAFVECPLAHPSLALRRCVLERFGYRERGWPEDYDLLLRLLRAGHRLGVVPRRLLAWRDGPERLSRTHPDYALSSFTECKAEHLALGFLADAAEYVLWGYGDTGRALRRALELRGRSASHIVELHPGRLGQRIHDAPVVPPEALPSLARRPIVASVAGAGPRGQIRESLRAMGFCELRDFVCAA